ncbi:MAG TPA: N-acetyltransferase [Haliangium sp.]|nr:N-acetyltransferase [Haliangium sp.]
MTEPIVIRRETAADQPGIRRVHERAFPTAAEAGIVDALRAAGAVTLSLVAGPAGEAGQAAAPNVTWGHILFSPVIIATATGERAAVGLAPLAVDPDWQRRGVGGRLVRAGLDILRREGHPAVVVLGHPDYYPRFGFAPASRFGLRWEHPCRDEAFMAVALAPHGLDGTDQGPGVVRYRPELMGV